MNRETGLRLVLAVAILAAPLLPVFAVDLAPERETFADSSRAVDQLDRLFRDESVAADPVQSRVLVTVRLREAGALSTAGIDVQRRYVQQGTHHVEGYMPLSAVRDLSTDPAVETIRLRDIRGPGGRVTDGAARIGALALHERGLTGENVTVGIIDGDFRVSHPELVGHVAAYRSFGTTGDGDHGTAVASVIADTAPDADIHVAAVGDETSADEYREAVTWLRASGADIIVDAGSYFGNAGTDTDALSAVARNASGEALFVTSAGNYGQRHWATVHEPSERRWVTFQPGAEGNPLAGGDVFAGRVRASLQWSPVDANATAADYELYLVRRGVGGQRVVASAAGEGGDAASLDATVPRGRYYLAVEGANASTTHRLELFATHDLTYRTPNGSLAVPATVPGVLTVGAYDYETGGVAAFSSRGPVDNRTGVDLVAPDTVAAPGTDVTGGTSFAAPYAAGTAALLLERYPDATPTDLRAVLADSAHDVAAPGPDPAAGYGLLDATDAATLAEARFGAANATADGAAEAGADRSTAAATNSTDDSTSAGESEEADTTRPATRR